MARLFVGNLPYSATETDVQNFFSDAGYSVDSVNVMRDRFSGEARGFGFVEISDEQQAQAAIAACNGKDFSGRALVINEARPMSRDDSGGGGSRGPRGGGGGGNSGGGGPRQRDFGGSKNRW